MTSRRGRIATLGSVDVLRNLLPPALVAAGAGVWDYDVASDRVVSCGVVADLYNLPDIVMGDGIPLGRLAVGVHPTDRTDYLERVAGLRLQGGTINAAYRTVSIEGRIHKVLVRGRCDRDHDGSIIHASGLVLDLTASVQDSSACHDALAEWAEATGRLAALNLAADFALAARQVIDTIDLPSSSDLVEKANGLLLAVGREIAQAAEHSPKNRIKH